MIATNLSRLFSQLSAAGKKKVLFSNEHSNKRLRNRDKMYQRRNQKNSAAPLKQKMKKTGN